MAAGMWADIFPLGWVPLVVGLLVLLALCWLWPYGPLRLTLGALSRSLFWLRVRGRDRLPRKGPALLVCNATGCLDPLLLLPATGGFVRLVVLAGWTSRWGVRHLLRWAGAITLEGQPTQAALFAALQRARDALARGERVCLFIEGYRPSDGDEVPFHRVLTEVLGGTQAPLVPVSLGLAWGSLLPYQNGNFRRHLLLDWPYPVDVGFGDPLPPGTPPGEVRQAQQLLSANEAVAGLPRRRTVHCQFLRVSARWPLHSCSIDSSSGRALNYGKAAVGAICLARHLRPMLGEAPMVALWLPSSLGGALANIAVALMGKTSVNLNYTAGVDSLHSALRQCGCTHVLTARKFTARMPLDVPPGVELIYLEDLQPKISKWEQLRTLLMVWLLPGWVLERVLGAHRHRLDDLATVIFSSGSTGEPKGVMLTHGNVAANVESMLQAVNLGHRDRLLVVLPFFHSFGYTVGLWAPLQIGASAVFHPDPRQAREIGELCKKYACTLYISTATFLRFCLKKCDPDDFASLRLLICGAEKLPPALAQDFAARFGILPLEGYGCTELAPVASANLPDEPCDGFTVVHNRIGTVGMPIPGVVGRIVDPDSHRTLSLGEEGLLVMYGGNVMKGYLGKPDLTKAALLDGWYITGDMGKIDADGHITLTGRLSRFAKVGGEMVPLERIEEELHDVLGTSERVCVVSCVPDASRGERLVVLYVAAVLTQFGREVRPWCQDLGKRGLPNLWVPSERDFFAVAELPVLGSGKVNLKGCKDLALSLVGG